MTHIPEFTAPSDGPAAVLVRLVRRMRLRHSSVFVAGRSAAHPQPDSLLALVDVGAEVGLKITAARADVSQLEGLPTPLIAHFDSEDGGGFGILEGSDPEGFRIYDSAFGSRTIDRDSFSSMWSGIVALVERDKERERPETGYARNRLLEILAGTGDPPALAGSRSAPVVRVALGALVTVLIASAIARHPDDGRIAALAIAALALVGFGITVAMANATVDPSKPFALPGCPRGKRVDCQSVLTSPYSRIYGIPLSEIGIAFFGSILMAIAVTAPSPGGAMWDVIGLAFLASIPFSLALVALQIGMKQFCTLCMGVHVVNLSGAALGLTFLDGAWSGAATLSAAALFATFFMLALFLGIPYFTRTQRLRAVVQEQQRAASSPFATLAHVLTAPETAVDSSCGIRLEGPSAGHCMVLFVHPSCSQCARTIEEARPLAASGSVEITLALAPKEAKGPDRDACAAIVSVGLAEGPAAFLDAFAVAKRDFPALAASDPAGTLAEALGAERDRITSNLDEARAIVTKAERLADALVEGTPAAFLDARLVPYTAPLGHISFLLSRHPDLLAPLVSHEGRRLHL